METLESLDTRAVPELVVIPTIDVEGTHGSDPFRQMVLGEIGGKTSWGVHRIAEELNAFNLQGTFFVDVYEYTLWGKDRWRAVCENLTVQGQDVQLHTHPGWRSDDPRDDAYPWLQALKRECCYVSDKRYLMTHLSRAEQLEMIRHGAELISEWTGKRPIAHRSGEYAANLDTLEALCEAGFQVDCSQHSSHAKSDLRLSRNALAQYKGLLEIPVTVYDRALFPGIKHPKLVRRTKSDLGFGFSQLQKFCRLARRSGIRVVTLFMHSYSFLRLGPYDRVLGPDVKAADDLRRFLAWAADTGWISTMSVAAYYRSKLWEDALLSTSDPVPCISNIGDVGRAIARRLKRSRVFARAQAGLGL